MSLTFPYRFALAMFREDGSSLGTVLAERDWEPVREWTRFYFQRRGELPLNGDGSASILPLWERTLGEPYCRGYRVEIPRPGRRPVASDFPKTHFRECAGVAAGRFVERRQLREGDTYTYLLVAHPAPPEPVKPGGLTVTNTSPSVPARDGALAPYLARVKPMGVVDSDDMPVFVSRQVLREAEELTNAKKGIETGGILIGLLWRDAEAGEIFAEVTAQIPAEHTSSSHVKLTFTPQTWAAAEAALRLRGRGEIYLGYYHSHPVFSWCRGKECTPEKQKTCRLAKDFFSADDEAFMRAAFPRAYNLGLVVNDTAFTGLTFSMFGNREGMIQPRGFYLLEENPCAT
jgi:hypothetical protein